MAGHVNMMDDVLIAQLPVPLLRSALRVLVAQGACAQKAFVAHIRSRLHEAAPEFTPAAVLFSDRETSAGYLAHARCLFSSKLVMDALPYLTHFVKCIPEAQLRWTDGDVVEKTLDRASGDIVQAMQALKETRAVYPAKDLEVSITALQDTLFDCEAYCLLKGLAFPFIRALLQVNDALRLLFPCSVGADRPCASPTPQIELTPNDLKTPARRLEYVQLGPIRVPRLFNGLWQSSSPAWGSASRAKQDAALTDAVRAGLVAADMADHYGDAELIYGSFRNRLPDGVAQSVVAATKWCVFAPPRVPVDRAFVLDAVMERCERLGGRVELLQFHWYDYSDKQYLLVLEELVAATHTHPHLVSAIGLCNFDAEHAAEACEFLLARTGRVGIVSNQVQYSLIDSRPRIKMAEVCERYGIRLLTYGSFCGGFLSEKWLGANSPDIYSESQVLTPSQRKYFDMILTWGTWADLQRLLWTLKSIADEHNVELSNVATRWVLDNPGVGAVIVGTRLGVSSNVDSNMNVFGLRLTEEESRRIEDVAIKGHLDKVYEKMGDCGHEYRH